MAKHEPLWCRASAVMATLEVAHTLAVLSESDTAVNRIATTRHIAALVDSARETLDGLVTDIELLEESRESMEEQGNV